MTASSMERLSVKALRELAAGHDIDIHGFPEKTDIVQKISSELAKKFRIAEEKVNEHLAQLSAAECTSPAVDVDASLIVPENTNYCNLAICDSPGVAGMNRGMDV